MSLFPLFVFTSIVSVSPGCGTAFVLPTTSCQFSALLKSLSAPPPTHFSSRVGTGSGSGAGSSITYWAQSGPWVLPCPMFCVHVAFFGSGRFLKRRTSPDGGHT